MKQSPQHEAANSQIKTGANYYQLIKYYYLDTYGFVQVTYASNYKKALKNILANRAEGLS